MSQNRGSSACASQVLGHSSPPGSSSNSGMNLSPATPTWSHVNNGASSSGVSPVQKSSAPSTHLQQQQEAKAIVSSPQCGNQIGTTLKEHDLLGLSDVSSSSSREKSAQENTDEDGNEREGLNLNLGATELRLGPPAARKKNDVGFSVPRIPTPEASDKCTFLGGLDVGQAADAGLVRAEKSSSAAEQNPAEQAERAFSYGSSATCQGGRLEKTVGGTGCKALIESESLMKWHSERGSDRKAANEALRLGMSLLAQECLDEKAAFLNSIDMNREGTQETKRIEDSSWRQEPISEECPSPAQEQQQQKLKPHDVFQVPEKRSVSERKSLPAVQNPEQRFQAMAERSPRPQHDSSSGRPWPHQLNLRNECMAAAGSEFQTQQELEGRTGLSALSNGFSANRNMYATPKLGAKRNFDAITAADSRAFSEARNGLPSPSPAAAVSMNTSNGASSEAEMKAQTAKIHPWATKPSLAPTTWNIGIEHSGGSFGPFPSSQRKNTAATTTEIITCVGVDAKALQEAVTALSQKMPPTLEAKPSSSDAPAPVVEAPPASTSRAAPAAVGWPPLRSSFRMNLTTAPRPPAPVAECPSPRPPPTPSPPSAAPAAPTPPSVAGQSNSWFVKVYMDGVLIGRKVDLRSNNSYVKLTQQLDDMFRGCVNAGQNNSSNRMTLLSDRHRNFLHGSDYVLTYEDKEGDLMLVGDVPWEMFIYSVKRLRIMKGTEAIGLGSRTGDKGNKTATNV